MQITNMATHKRGRDADNGRFIPVKVAERRDDTAIVETFKTDKNGKKIYGGRFLTEREAAAKVAEMRGEKKVITTGSPLDSAAVPPQLAKFTWFEKNGELVTDVLEDGSETTIGLKEMSEMRRSEYQALIPVVPKE